jgi:hypothetical protein
MNHLLATKFQRMIFKTDFYASTDFSVAHLQITHVLNSAVCRPADRLSVCITAFIGNDIAAEIEATVPTTGGIRKIR